MVIIKLFLAFMKIGFTSFGGMSMIPLILQEMEKNQWMTAEDLANLIAIAEMTPGPLGINCATFAGVQTAGIIGGIAAVMGVLVPAYTVTLIAAIFLSKFYKNKRLENIMSVVKPVCIAMLLDVILTLSAENYMFNNNIDWFAVGISIVAIYLIQKRKWSVPKVIGSAAVLGILGYGNILKIL